MLSWVDDATTVVDIEFHNCVFMVNILHFFSTVHYIKLSGIVI